jgi:3-methyladenine DNA glycosylase AlkD
MSYTDDCNDILDALKAEASPERKQKTVNYAPTAQEILGVSNPDLRRVLKAIRRAHKDWEADQWIGLGIALVRMGIFECQVTGYELLAENRKVLAAMTAADAKELMLNLDNWASVDHFSVGIHGVLWRLGAITDEWLMELLASENVWERRVAVVSTVALNTKSRGGEGDASRTLAICQKVVDERHPMIWKALSWALRSLVRWDREAVEGFLMRYESRMSRQVLREVRHKLEHGTKN